MWLKEIDRPAAASPARRAIDPRWLSDTMGAVYDCVLAPERWPGVVESICTELSFVAGVMAIAQLRTDAHPLTAQFGADEDWLARGSAYFAEMSDIWGGQMRIQAFPLDEPILASRITPASRIVGNAYFRDILAPRGIGDSVGVALAREPRLTGYLSLSRHVSAGAVGTRELDALRLIAPHLRRAVTIGNLFDLKAVEAATFRAVLDGMATASVLVDGELGIVHANAAAETMLADGGVFQRLRGALVLRGSIAMDALRAAVGIAAEDEARLSQRGIGIPVTAVDGSPSVLHVMPLARGERRQGAARRAVAAIFALPSDAAHAPVDAIAALYDFTPAEAQIFASLARGTSLDRTAEALGIARSTARTHLLRVFAKTGVGRQAELVALAAKLSPTI